MFNVDRDAVRATREENAYYTNLGGLVRSLYPGGAPGVNKFAMQVIIANFKPEQLVVEGFSKSDLAMQKLGLLELPFKTAVFAGRISGYHGDRALDKMQEVYTDIINQMNDSSPDS